MNFSGFFENPVEFIQEWIQNDEVSGSSDFLIEENIKTAFQLNPRLIKHIPLVNSLSDVQKTPPGKLVRIRCVMRNDIGKIIIPKLIRTQDGNYSYFSSSLIPSDVEVPDIMSSMYSDVEVQWADRIRVVAQLIDGNTDWLKAYRKAEKESAASDSDQEVLSTMRVLSVDAISPPATYILLNLDDAKNIRENYSSLIDVIGYFEDSDDEFNPGSFEAFSTSIPSFLGFAILPVSSLFEPVGYEIQTNSFLELREKTLAILNSVFEPHVSELMLLWFMNRTRRTVGSTAIGNLSLNLRNLNNEESNFVYHFISSLCSSITYLPLTIEYLNKQTLISELEDEMYTDTPLNTFNGNRFIVDETLITEGQLNEVGLSNIHTLIQLSLMQKSLYKPYDIREMEVSNPVMVLSEGKPLVECSMSVVCNSVVEPTIEPDEETLTLVRLYIETARLQEVNSGSKEEDQITINKLMDMRRSQKYTQEDMHIYADLAFNLMLSLGQQSMTQEIADSAYALFETLYRETPSE